MIQARDAFLEPPPLREIWEISWKWWSRERGGARGTHTLQGQVRFSFANEQRDEGILRTPSRGTGWRRCHGDGLFSVFTERKAEGFTTERAL